jgi:hypothetical protein
MSSQTQAQLQETSTPRWRLIGPGLVVAATRRLASPARSHFFSLVTGVSWHE